MLFIFRKLRRSFFLPGKVRTYVAYAIGEIVLIVVGIMIALEANEWKEEHRDRIEGKEVLVRITEEVRASLRFNSELQSVVQIKNEALMVVREAIKGNPIKDKTVFLSKVSDSLRHDMDHPFVPRTTFDEIVDSGKLSLIRNIELRNHIMHYYNRMETMDRSFMAKTGDYPRSIYGLVRRETIRYNLENLEEEEISAIVKSILNSDLDQQILYEINRSDIMKRRWKDAEIRMNELIAAIETELAYN